MSNENQKRGGSELDQTPCSAKLANEIAEEILTVWDSAYGTECTRAQMMLLQPDGTERNMGGRNKASIASVIESHLDEFFKQNLELCDDGENT